MNAKNKFSRFDTTTKRPIIRRVWTSRKVDDSHTSYLGEYSNLPGPADRTIERENCGSREFRYFVAAMSGEDTGNPESVQQDFDRMESLNNGDWCYVGIVAYAEVVTAAGIIQRLQSGGLWGIESDSGVYMEEIQSEQLEELRGELRGFGFTKRATDKAFLNVDTDD